MQEKSCLNEQFIKVNLNEQFTHFCIFGMQWLC